MLGKHCVRFKHTKSGRRCAEFSDGLGNIEYNDGDPEGLADFGAGAAGVGVVGPLIGGGVAQAVTTAVKFFGKDRAIAKWAAGIGLLVGGGLSAVLAARRSTRELGISGLVTA